MQPIKTFPLLPTAATIVIFLLDLLTPLGINLWIFYLIPFLLIYQSHRSRFLIAMAGFTSTLALAGFFLSPAGLDPFSETINRTIGVGVLWMSVALLMKLGKSETERRVLQEQTHAAGRQVEEILENIGDAFVALDKDWRYVYMNKKAGEIFARDPERMIGKHIWTEFPEGVGQPFHRAYEKAMAEQQFQSLEEYYPPYDRWFENRIYPSKEGLTIFFTEITDRKKAEQELRRAKELYQDLVETSQDLIWQCDAEGRFTYLNRAWEQTHGYAIEEMIGKTFSDFQSPEFAERDMNEFSRLMQGNMVKNYETIHLAKDGRVVYLVFNARFYIDKEGKISGTMGTAHDITERKRAESLVALESQVLSMVAQQEPLAPILERIVLNIETLSQETVASILLMDPDGVHVHYGASPHLPDSYNRAIEGAPIGPVAGSCGTAAYRKELVIVTDIETDPLWENYRDLILPHGLRSCWSKPIINKQGKVLGTFAMYYKEPRSPKPGDLKLIEFVTHLTLITLERKQAEEALRKSEETYSVIFKKAPFAAGLTNIPDGTYLEVNEQFEHIFGFSREETIGKTSLELGMHSDPEVRARSAEIFHKQGYVHNLDMRLQKRSGEIHDMLINSDLVEIGGVKYILTTANDITERKQAEESLQAHRQLLETVVNHVPAAVSLLRGSDLRLQLLNPAYQAIAPGKEMLGRTWDELWAETGQNFTAICRKVLETGEPHHVVDELNMIRRSPDEPAEPAYFSWSLHRVKLPGNDGWGLLGTAWETTSRKQVEQEIEQSREQLRALTNHLQTVIEEERARIAREIHDDIGQLLTATKMNLSLLGRTIDEMKEKKIQNVLEMEIEALVKLLDEGVHSIRKIVRDLRPEVLETLGLLAGVEWQAKEFKKRTGVQVSLSLPKKLSNISSTHTTTLFRAVQEGLTNIARHSQATKAIINLKISAGTINLRIQDNGRGISQEQLKRPGSFGLLAMRERVTALGGTLTIEGKPGEGTMLEVAFPLS